MILFTVLSLVSLTCFSISVTKCLSFSVYTVENQLETAENITTNHYLSSAKQMDKILSKFDSIKAEERTMDSTQQLGTFAAPKHVLIFPEEDSFTYYENVYDVEPLRKNLALRQVNDYDPENYAHQMYTKPNTNRNKEIKQFTFLLHAYENDTKITFHETSTAKNVMVLRTNQSREGYWQALLTKIIRLKLSTAATNINKETLRYNHFYQTEEDEKAWTQYLKKPPASKKYAFTLNTYWKPIHKETTSEPNYALTQINLVNSKIDVLINETLTLKPKGLNIFVVKPKEKTDEVVKDYWNKLMQYAPGRTAQFHSQTPYGIGSLWSPAPVHHFTLQPMPGTVPEFIPTRTKPFFDWSFSDEWKNADWPVVELTLTTRKRETLRKTNKGLPTFVNLRFSNNIDSVIRELKQINQIYPSDAKEVNETTEMTRNEHDTKENNILRARGPPRYMFDYRRGSCYTCGLNVSDIPNEYPNCQQIFSPYFAHYIPRKLKHGHVCEPTIKGKVTHEAFRGGCFHRWLDVGDVYDERGCRYWPPLQGKTYISKRMAATEAVLWAKDEGCTFSPSAILTPFSRAVSLWARYHVCVCPERYCNNVSKINLPVLLIMFNIFHTI